MSRRVSVVIPHLEGERGLLRCLDSLNGQTFHDFEVIVVDNGSTDGSVDVARMRFPEVIFLRQDRNLGFAGGVNRGIEHSKAEFVALLNDDAIADSKWLEKMVMRLQENSGGGACTARIMRAEGELLDSAGNAYTNYGIPYPRGRDSSVSFEPGEVFAMSGGACLLRSKVLDEVGLFDEDFFIYHEDVDLSFRMRLAGHSILYEPSAMVRHEMGGSSGGGYRPIPRFHSVKNSWFVYLKDMPGALFWRYLPRFLLAQLLMFGNSLRRGLVVPHLRGIAAGIFGTPDTLRKRKAIQSARRTEVSDIDRLLDRNLPPMYRTALRFRK